MTEDEKSKLLRSLRYNNLFNKDSWYDQELDEASRAAWKKSDQYKVYNEITAAMLKDVDAFVESYNYKDCDSMIDYFHVDFYYFGCKTDDLKIVPKTARINHKNAKPTKTNSSATAEGNVAKTENTVLPEDNTNYTYKITKGEDTRDGSELWLVRIVEKLDRAAYIAENKAMQERGGYYSKFRKAFIFRFDPSKILIGGNAA